MNLLKESDRRQGPEVFLKLVIFNLVCTDEPARGLPPFLFWEVHGVHGARDVRPSVESMTFTGAGRSPLELGVRDPVSLNKTRNPCGADCNIKVVSKYRRIRVIIYSTITRRA